MNGRFRIVLYYSEVFDLLLAKEKILLNIVNIGIQIYLNLKIEQVICKLYTCYIKKWFKREKLKFLMLY